MAESSMALDRSSPVLGPVDQMELEVAEPGLAEPVTTSAAFVRDLDMEYDQEESVRLPAEALDHDMSQDTGEKGMDIGLDQPPLEQSDQHSSTPEAHIQPLASAQPEDSSASNTDKPVDALDQPEEYGTPTQQHSALPPQDTLTASAVQESLDNESTLAIPQNLETNLAETTEDTLEDPYTDAPEPYEPVASTSAIPYVPPSHSLARPTLQKDYLSVIELQNAHGDIAPANLTAGRFSPHVSLSYNGSDYSLFRPSSTPSGDDEEVLFSEGVDALGGTHSLYYASLDSLIEALHQAFPALKGEGESEILLDFGFLDLQISQDNVYSQQVSLFDLDRIRIGLCQPEFDRLQITLKPNKRFAFRFNELAEHCYRMFSGSEEDSGTIYAEDLDPLPEPNDSLTAPYPDDPALPVQAVEEQPADPNASQLELPPSGLDDEPHGDVAESETVDNADGLPDTLVHTDSSIPANGQLPLSAESADEHGDVHPPTDEPYEDPEFLYHDVEQLEEYVEETAEEVAAAGDIGKEAQDAEELKEDTQALEAAYEAEDPNGTDAGQALNGNDEDDDEGLQRDVVKHPTQTHSKKRSRDVETEEGEAAYAEDATASATEIELKRPKITV